MCFIPWLAGLVPYVRYRNMNIISRPSINGTMPTKNLVIWTIYFSKRSHAVLAHGEGEQREMFINIVNRKIWRSRLMTEDCCPDMSNVYIDWNSRPDLWFPFSLFHCLRQRSHLNLLCNYSEATGCILELFSDTGLQPQFWLKNKE